MRLLLAAVGRAKTGPTRQLFDSYASRLSPPLALQEVELRGSSKTLPPAKRREGEAALLLEVLARQKGSGGTVIVALDERGVSLDSAGFADRLASWRQRGVGSLAFVIGGADGHGAAVRERAELVLSLGKMTWPHMLARAMLAEQLYRAQCIERGHPYHRD